MRVVLVAVLIAHFSLADAGKHTKSTTSAVVPPTQSPQRREASLKFNTRDVSMPDSIRLSPKVVVRSMPVRASASQGRPHLVSGSNAFSPLAWILAATDAPRELSERFQPRPSIPLLAGFWQDLHLCIAPIPWVLITYPVLVIHLLLMKGQVKYFDLIDCSFSVVSLAVAAGGYSRGRG